MNTRALFLILLACLMAIPGMADESTDDELYIKFLDYTIDTYLKDFTPETISISNLYGYLDQQTQARVLGYSLGNLLKFARRGSINHKIWLILEKKLKQDIEKTIDREGQIRGWEPSFVEKLQKRFWQECMMAQQGWYNVMLIADTKVSPMEAPNFFATVGGTGSEGISGTETDPDPGSGEESDTPYKTVSDEILGLWTFTNEYEIHGRIVRQKLVIDVRRAGSEERQTATGPMPKYFYEGYVAEIKEITDEWSRPLAAEGELIWKLEYTKTRREPSERVLGYSLNNLKDRRAAYGIRLLRQEGILEVGQAKYYRGDGR